MREVRTCDFCGDQAAGVFEVVTPERDPTGEGRRMVLCRGCRDTLASVLEPLLGVTADRNDDGGEDESTTVVAEPDRETNTDASTVADGATTTDGEQETGGTGPASNPGADGVSSASDDDDGTDGTDGTEASGRPRRARRGTPRGYRKVMRFLENREFPMEREKAETLVTEAYELDPETVSATIDHAVKHNRLREASGKLFQ